MVKHSHKPFTPFDSASPAVQETLLLGRKLALYPEISAALHDVFTTPTGVCRAPPPCRRHYRAVAPVKRYQQTLFEAFPVAFADGFDMNECALFPSM